MKNIIIISAHPDDEILGAGGTILKHIKQGDNVYWLITTNILNLKNFSQDQILKRNKEIEAIKNKVGFKKLFILDYPAANLSSSSLISMVPKISDVFNEVKPEIVYCVNRTDAHSDHLFTFNAVMACTKSFRYPFIKKVLLYECISETEFAPAIPEKVFQPNYFIDISNFIDDKINLMKIYESELGSHPFPRSIRNIKALATFRGATCGVEYAEAFQLIKYID